MIDLSISHGDFLDRKSIAELKVAFGKQDAKILEPFKDFKIDDLFVIGLYDSLYSINKGLWFIEDEIRDELDKLREVKKDFEASEIEKQIVALSLEIVRLNDARARLKKQIDLAYNDNYDSKVYAGKNGYSI